MSQAAPANALSQPKKTGAYYIKSAIGIAIMVFFQFLPAPVPITPAGMALLGYFIGLVVLWTLVDLMWPTFLAIIMFSFQAREIFPGSYQLHGIHEAGIQSFGNWIVVFVIGCLILCVALEEAGTIRRLTFWFLTRKFAKQSPWKFTFMLLLAGMCVSLFLDVTPAQFFMLAIAHELFDVLGFKKGEHWPQIVTVGITFTAILGFAMTPICHTLPILFMGISSSISGIPANMLAYMLVCVPIGFVIWFLMFAWFRYVVKPDISRFDHVDFALIDAKRPGPMQKREKTTVAICILVLIGWILPGFLSFLLPGSSFYLFMEEITATAPLFLGIVALALIHVEGEPLLHLPSAFSKIAWVPVVLLAGIMMIAGSMGEDTTGIPGFLAMHVVPLADGLSPFAVVAVIAVLSCVLTNIANNVPVGIIFIAVGTPMAMAMGLNPVLVAVAVCMGANLAYTIPPAYVPIGVCYADPYGGASVTLKNGIVMAIISCAVLAVMLYPLGKLVYG